MSIPSELGKQQLQRSIKLKGEAIGTQSDIDQSEQALILQGHDFDFSIASPKWTSNPESSGLRLNRSSLSTCLFENS